MDEFKDFYFKIPPITRYFLTSLFITATIATYIMSLQIIIYYIFLDYTLIFSKLQLWRLFTNLLFIGAFSTNFLFFVVMVYLNFKAMEQSAIVLRAHAVFIMMLFYILIFLHIINLFAFKVFGIKPGFTLASQLLLSLIYINSKREPQKIVTLYFFRMKNCFFPYALIVFNIVSGGGIYDNIMGIIAGNIYFVLKDVLPESKVHLDILKTPKFLVDFCEKYYYDRLPREDTNNNNNGNDNGQFGFGNSGVMNRGGRNNNNNANRGFTAFGGRGYTVG